MMKRELILFLTLAMATSAFAQEMKPGEVSLSNAYQGTSYSPYAGRAFPSRPLWGDSHLHTGNSFDAGAFGARLLPEDAYRFARGEEVVSSTGIPVRLSRPLDWLVVADHSDNMGFFTDLVAGAPHLMADPLSRDWYNRVQAGEGAGVAYEDVVAGPADHVLQVRQAVAAGLGAQSSPGREVDGDAERRAGEGNRVDIEAAVQGVVARAAAADDQVVSRPAGHLVVAGSAVERVVPGPAVQDVVARAARERVVAAETADGIVARRAVQVVGAFGARDVFAAGALRIEESKGVEVWNILITVRTLNDIPFLRKKWCSVDPQFRELHRQRHIRDSIRESEKDVVVS